MRAQIKERVSGGGNYFAKPKDDVEFIPSGCLMLDLALGGGWAENHVLNIIGDKSTGKTLLAIEMSANFIKKHPKGRVRYREVESAFQTAYAGALGMPLDRVDFGKQQYETVEDLYEELDYRCENADGPELLIVDSLDALSSRAEQGRNIDVDSYGGEKAKKMSEVFRRKVRAMQNARITLLIISQIRDKIGVRFGKKWTRTGGKALDFYATQSVVLASLGPVSRSVNKIKRPVGIDILAKVDKNKIAQPYRQASFELLFGYGLHDPKACIDWLKKNGGLPMAALTDMKEEAFINTVMNSNDDANVTALIDKLHKHTTNRWYEIEESFLPKRKKYG